MTVRVRTLVLVALGVAVLGVIVMVSGVVPIKASSGHWAVTKAVLKFSMRRSVTTHAASAKVPDDVDDESLARMAAGHYQRSCRPCHGGPDLVEPSLYRGLTPTPPSLLGAAERWDAAELFFIVQHGVKFTGMPAWPTQAREDEVWAMVAFLRTLPSLDARDYRDWTRIEGADRAPPVVRECVACHGLDGRSNGRGATPRLAGQHRAYLEQALAAYAKDDRPSGIMGPIARELTQGERSEAARWFAALPRVRPEPAAPAGSGIALAQRGDPARKVPACLGCHGERASTEDGRIPRLEGQDPAYLERQLELFAAGVRGGGEMKALMGEASIHRLEPDEIVALARTLSRSGLPFDVKPPSP